MLQLVVVESQLVVHAPAEQTWPAGQTMPQPPQLVGSLLVSVQTPRQRVPLSKQPQLPLWQLVPPPQRTPHAPQSRLLVCRSTHALPHVVSPVAQAPVHSPDEQSWLPVQALPHVPQSSGLVERLTHTPLQLVSPAGQAHIPLKQLWPLAQVVPHAPQLLSSLAVLTHAPLQLLSPVAQVVAQWLREQTIPPPHAVPQAPQLAGSELMSTHALLQLVVPPRHPLQTPPVQATSLGQALPHAPQLVASLDTSVQVPLQLVVVPVHTPSRALEPQAAAMRIVRIAKLRISKTSKPINLARQEAPGGATHIRKHSPSIVASTPSW